MAMRRRNFLKTGSLIGFSLSSLFIGTNDLLATEKRAAGLRNRKTDSFELEEATITELQTKMQNRIYTSRLLTELYLKRIDEIDRNGPKINSVIEINNSALSIADTMDRERSLGKVRGPLHGIPILIKDNINTADGMHTSAGSLALANNYAGEDAFIVKKLREAGAVILGKTNLSEWANFRSTHSTSGWSSRGGQTKCPYILDRSPCGSSSGSAAAVAANLCVIAIGTETDGSIVCPSSVNGLVGIKPTVGLWSRTGIIPISKRQDTAGPMARTVKDAAILLGALSDIDPRDSMTLNNKERSLTDYTKFLDVDGLKGKRLGVEKSAFSDSRPEVIKLLEHAIVVLKNKGAIIVEIDLIEALKSINQYEITALLYEFKDGLNEYLAAANIEVKNLAELIAFNRQNEVKTMPFFKQEFFEAAQSKGDLNSTAYVEAIKKVNTGSRQVIDGILASQKLDAIIAPT